MRKIKTRAEINKKKRKNQIIIGVVMIGLLVFSYLGYSISSRDDDDNTKKEYNDFKFIRVNNLWALELDKQIFYFQYLPQEVENVSVDGFYNLESYVDKPLYFVNNNPASGEILNNLNKYISRYQEACLNETNCSKVDLPVKTCGDNLIVFKEGEDKVWQENNCVYISGEFIKGADVFLYNLLKVM